jgi:hypothetical protein
MALLVGIGGFVITLVAVMMARRGQSLRPIVWFAVLFGLIVGPQAAYHAAVAAGWIGEARAWTFGDDTSPRETAAVDEAGMTHADGRFSSPARVFGADVDPDLITDARPVYWGAFV